ncbi:unnamed protein product, partial [Darwinula stevensoni]
EEAIKNVKSGDRIFIQGAASTPNTLINALVANAENLKDVEICHLHTIGEAKYSLPEYENSFMVNNFFIGGNVRKTVGKTRNQYIPIFLSEIPLLFKKNYLPLDVVFIHVSPPDKHGFCSLGLSVDATVSALKTAKLRIAQVNPYMPRSHGDGIIHKSKIDFAVHSADAIPEESPAPISEEEKKIGEYIAGIIDDGACIQMGIGGIPNAVLSCLGNHKNLGIHTEMFSDGVIPLVESGVINGLNKKSHPGKIVSTFATGSKKLYDFIDDNPMVAMLDVSYTNDTAVIRKNPRVTAINSAIEIDLTGQVCADSIGSIMYSGIGGQMDFIRGASLSKEGKPIIAMTSTSKKGVNKIVPFLKQGAGVVSTRGHMHYIATEYGIVDLYGKNLSQRAKALISIAHPNFREDLEIKAKEIFGKKWRGLLHQMVPHTDDLLNKESNTAYIGFDPTADSLHIGSLVPIILLKHLQKYGHQPIALIGGATGMIGDPSGKSNERNLLDETQLNRNSQGIKAQLHKLLHSEINDSNKIIIVDNYKWMKDFSFIEFARDIGKHITVNYMMAKDSVKSRISGEDSEGMSFTEFTYQLLQAYDFLFLYQTFGCKIQLGGSDQWGNITTGIELIRRKAGGEAFAITCPLTTKHDGSKFGKSEVGENIWLDLDKTSAFKFYQFWINTTDVDAEKFIKIYTFLEKEYINNLIEEHKKSPHLRLLQKKLAEEVTMWVHGEEELNSAILSTDILFGNRNVDDLKIIDIKSFRGVPQKVIYKEDISN